METLFLKCAYNVCTVQYVFIPFLNFNYKFLPALFLCKKGHGTSMFTYPPGRTIVFNGIVW